MKVAHVRLRSQAAQGARIDQTPLFQAKLSLDGQLNKHKEITFTNAPISIAWDMAITITPAQKAPTVTNQSFAYETDTPATAKPQIGSPQGGCYEVPVETAKRKAYT